MKKFIIYCFAATLSSSWLPAQNANDKNQSDKSTVRTAWLICTNIPEDLENPITLITGKDILQITLSKRSPSEAVKIPADGLIRVVRKVDNPKEPNKPSYVNLAELQVTEGINNALIILNPIPKSPEGLLFETQVQDLSKFNGGEWLYINTTKFKMRIEIGEENLLVNPSESKIYKPKIASESTNMSISYSPDKPAAEKWKVISSSNIAIYPTRKEICIFTWDERRERIDYHGITLPAL